MPTTVTGSTNISSLDSQILVDACAGVFIIDATPSVFIGSGANEALGVKVKITNPYGVVVKDYDVTYDIPAPFTDVYSFNIPTVASAYDFGEYIIDLQITDADSTTHEVSKPVDLDYPDRKNKSKNYALIGANLKAVCKEGKLYVAINSLPTYNGIIAGTTVQTGTLEYPTSSNLEMREDVTSPYFSDYLFEGVYKLKAEICATYVDDDNVSYKVKYKVNVRKEVFCQIDECAVLASLVDINKKLDEDCTDADKEKYSNLTLDALRLLKTAQLANDCGEDASEYILQLEGLLGCKCTCSIEDGAPVVDSSPASDILIEGCNVATSTNGLTRIYTINNYEYLVSINENAILTASAPTLTSCTKTIPLTFNVGAMYAAVKTYSNQDTTEAAFWASVVNKGLDSVDVTCLGAFGTGWASMTFVQRITAIKEAACVGVNIVIPSIPSIPTVTGTTNTIAKFTGATAVGNSQITDNGTAVQLNSGFTGARLNVSNTNPAQVAAVYASNVQPASNTQDLLGVFTELKLTGAGLTQSNRPIFGSNFSAIYFQQTGNQTYLGDENAAVIGSLVLSLTGGSTLDAPIVAGICAVVDFTDDGIYKKIAGVYVAPAAKVSYEGRPIFSGSVEDMYGIYLAPRNAGAVFPTRTWGVYQAGSEDINWFAAKAFFSNTYQVPSSAVDIDGGFGYNQLRLRKTYTPSSSADTNGQIGDICHDANYLYKKEAAGWTRSAIFTTF